MICQFLQFAVKRGYILYHAYVCFSLLFLHMHITLSHTQSFDRHREYFFVIYLLIASPFYSLLLLFHYPYFHISLYSLYSIFMYSIFNLRYMANLKLSESLVILTFRVLPKTGCLLSKWPPCGETME